MASGPGSGQVTVSGRAPLPARAAERVIQAVLRGEGRVGPDLISLHFVGRDRMRALHGMYRGHPHATDVLAFALRGPDGGVAGDVYVCPWVAAREARRRRVPLREELIRDVIHGVLHVLGHDHPDDDSRVRSPMWRRQERYVKTLR